ncbi:MAG: hypothetical protein UR93_C0010G0011 [Berkelbacteria bacterium GW2011_GWA2_35_9]|uniref:Uncharacterized protein n=1 Tax=Berkelbacteria bacterium GW2011_GWA2_35_9 TaxID=1618333 RepID=A0A0G0FMP3_9BACT|nr:MAG: hypothetical protein UR93_C0010G0011 [Berkelbacteria bacterium GW2011_GWA2_35_9]
MKKNIVLIVLVVVLIIAGVYAFIANQQSADVNDVDKITDTPIVVPAVENPDSNLPPSPPPTPDVK